ncbi:Aspartate/tyrosine/aromatic aminotransferase [Caldibacillus debilis GB1]|uniref:Aspartate/tyrosine/aromatic aminotransferase n=1 Tax=Caldibacillus debilis GB1 TaxID=1339248 RepID=A0A420VG63_9BACI|nr:Aspartate/tyrosine/aromatic aminotransferase [Caldibacillus debilis GB1]
MEFTADVIKTLPPYLFSIFEKRKEELKKKGVDVIDFGIGSPDLPPPAFVIDRLKRELDNPANYAYSPYIGIKEFRQAVADFFKREYGVDLDPDTEVLTLIGSKEGIVHLLQAVVNPGETVLVPDPGFQAYWKAVHLVKGEGYNYPLNEKNGYQPEFENIPEDVYKRTKFMFLNYPSNPTAATTTLDVFEEAVRLAKKSGSS